MAPRHDNVIYYGTTEPPLAERKFSAGALTLIISDGAIRNLSWHGIEVVRGIACPVRDVNWATCISVLADESVTITPGEFEISQVRLVADSSLRISLIFKGNSNGTFSATAVMTASREFITNRAGFTLLHPLRDVAGTSLSVIHPNGSVTSSQFPLLISPEQVTTDISGLRHCVNGIDTEIMFRGEIFEMEDQRNWSDASFKTYCRPLSLPIPYRLGAGETQCQEIHVRFLGTPLGNAPTATAPSTGMLELQPRAGNVPHLAAAIDDSTIPDQDAQKLAILMNPRILQLRVTPETALRVFERTRSLISACAAEIELEVIVPAIGDPETSIARVAADCKQASLAVARVLPFPERYLQSHQPAGPWPAGPRPQDLISFARRSFPEAEIGSGVLTYFTELNRCRPPAAMCDYIGHGTTAITHAADDRSVIESLEGLSHIYRSAGALAGTWGYRLGLVAIGMRSNPYGSGVMENILQNRIAMAGADPRQRGLFAAAWAVGAVALTEGHKVSSLALSALVGPFGAIHKRESWAQPIYQKNGAAMVYPIFHVLRFLSAMGGAPRFSICTAENGIAGVASQDHSCIRLIIANLGMDVSHLRLPHKAEIRSLNDDNFQSAINDPQWLDTSKADCGSEVALKPYCVAFARMTV
jgi:D-apionolactonase